MAITLAVGQSSPQIQRYTIIGDTLDESASRTAAQVIGDLAEGPLKEALRRADAAGDAAWTALGVGDLAVSIMLGGALTLGIGNITTALASFDAVVAGQRTLTFQVIKTGSVGGIVEVRLNHTLIR